MLKQIYCVEGTTCYVRPLKAIKVIKRSIGRFIAYLLVVLIFGLVLLSRAEGGLNAPYLVFDIIGLVILFLAILVYNVFYFCNYFYDLKDDQIIIRKGVIARREITIYYNKIQNVFVDQDFWDRIFRLYDVHIATADMQSASTAHIDGVNQKNAEILKNILLEKIKKSAVDKSI